VQASLVELMLLPSQTYLTPNDGILLASFSFNSFYVAHGTTASMWKSTTSIGFLPS